MALVFGVNVPLAVIVFFVAAAKLPAREHRKAGRLEWIGSALITIALIAVSLGLNAAEKTGFASARVLVPVAIGIVVVGIAALQQRHARVQMLDWSQLGRSPVPAALVLAVLLGRALSGSLFQLTQPGSEPPCRRSPRPRWPRSTRTLRVRPRVRSTLHPRSPRCSASRSSVPWPWPASVPSV
jgi:hypothetical protein